MRIEEGGGGWATAPWLGEGGGASIEMRMDIDVAGRVILRGAFFVVYIGGLKIGE